MADPQDTQTTVDDIVNADTNFWTFVGLPVLGYTCVFVAAILLLFFIGDFIRKWKNQRKRRAANQNPNFSTLYSENMSRWRKKDGGRAARAMEGHSAWDSDTQILSPRPTFNNIGTRPLRTAIIDDASPSVEKLPLYELECSRRFGGSDAGDATFPPSEYTRPYFT